MAIESKGSFPLGGTSPLPQGSGLVRLRGMERRRSRGRTLHIAALLPEAEAVESCLNAAVGAALGEDTRITALHIGYDPDHGWSSAEEADLQAFRNLSEGTVGERLAHIRAGFETWRSAAPERADTAWRECGGQVDICVGREAQDADLLVLVHPGNLDARDALHAALFRSKRLVLVVPRHRSATGWRLSRHIMIGWKPGEHARRAITAATPWLTVAERVTLVCINEPEAHPYHPSAVALLNNLDVQAELHLVRTEGESVGARLLHEAAVMDASCLLTGAFRHGALLELVLGGVTNDLLARASLPLLLMH